MNFHLSERNMIRKINCKGRKARVMSQVSLNVTQNHLAVWAVEVLALLPRRERKFPGVCVPSLLAVEPCHLIPANV